MRLAAKWAAILTVLLLAAPAAAQQPPQGKVDKAAKVAAVAGVYVGLMTHCNADTTAIR